MSKVLFAGTGENSSALSVVLQKNGYNVVSLKDPDMYIDVLEKETFDIFITEMQRINKQGHNLQNLMNKKYPEMKCICLSGKESPGEVLLTLEKPVKISTEAPAGKNGKKPFRFDGFIGKTDRIKKITKIVKKVSATDSTVLITGESGTGKELIARAVHKNSNRSGQPMIVINCGAIPGELLESELFGHEKGAFTSAHRTRIGRFELADGGTVFLDEIGDMSPDLQVKLLRVIQNRQFERVGGVKSINVDVRIISATNKDLEKAIKENRFREDLYYRLNVIPIEVPPLRDRKEDIPLLIRHFSEKLQKHNGWPAIRFSDRVLKILKSYRWAGNIRELENFVERMHVLAESDCIEPEQLPDYMPDESESLLSFSTAGCFDNDMGFNEAIDAHQRKLILHALDKSNWIKAKAAQMLKMKRTTLVEKIKKMNLEAEKTPFRTGQ